MNAGQTLSWGPQIDEKTRKFTGVGNKKGASRKGFLLPLLLRVRVLVRVRARVRVLVRVRVRVRVPVRVLVRV